MKFAKRIGDIAEDISIHVLNNLPAYMSGLILFAETTAAIGMIKTQVIESHLERTANVSYTKSYPIHLYGFDKDRNGTLDQIERVGIIPARNYPFPIHQVINPGHPFWDADNQTLISSGKRLR